MLWGATHISEGLNYYSPTHHFFCNNILQFILSVVIIQRVITFVGMWCLYEGGDYFSAGLIEEIQYVSVGSNGQCIIPPDPAHWMQLII